jgi:hypothetical protein
VDRFDVGVIPVLILFSNENMFQRFGRVQPKEDFIENINSILDYRK